MAYELDELFGVTQLDLNYEAHVVGIEGECFLYNVYLDHTPTDEDKKSVAKALRDFFDSEFGEEYPGYYDVTNEDEKIRVYLDLGNVEPNLTNPSIQGVLKALNAVSGVKTVLVNEDCDVDY